jgi:nucleoside-diphosphate-sugar epimerase
MTNTNLKVLVTGGAGYVGTSLVPQLLAKGYDVTVLDRLMWGGAVMIPFFKHNNFHFIKGDVRNEELMKTAVKDKDVIIHLAAIVGFPACDANPHMADTTNVESCRVLTRVVSKDQHVIFASSGSNYGRVVGQICTEETPVNPISRYSRNKLEGEQILMEGTTCTALRPGTAFGVSPRLRLDLLPHELTLNALKTKNIVLYEPWAIRPFIHVHDFGRAFIFAMENKDKMKNQIYNLGADALNYTKRQIADLVAAHTGATVEESTAWQDPDQRHYQVSYKKLHDLGYEHTISMDDGIKELLKVLPVTGVYNPYSNQNEILG